METQICLSRMLRRSLTLAAVLGAGTAMMIAQNTTVGTTPAASGAAYSSSSDSSSPAPAETASVNTPLNFLGTMHAMQYGGQYRYGRPRYRGGNTNPDGSQKFVFYAAGGFTAGTGPTHQTNTDSWAIQGGVGRQWNKHFGVNVEFDWDNFGLTKGILDNQANLYNNQIDLYNVYCVDNPTDPSCVANGGGISPLGAIDGYSHVWSFSLQPIYHLMTGDKWGAYVTGGAGFYHKISTFTTPEEGEYIDPYYGIPVEYEANEPIDSYTSNAPGIDAGIGLTYKFSHFSNEEFFAEARYVYVFNQYRPGVMAADCTTTACVTATDNQTNDYPYNSERTSYVPVKFGIRF